MKFKEPNLLTRFTRLVTHWETAEFRLTKCLCKQLPHFYILLKFLENIVGKLNIVQISVLVFVFFVW